MQGVVNSPTYLKQQIENSSLLLSDGQTFLVARMQSIFSGGGNWSIPLLGMVTLAFYSKINQLLESAILSNVQGKGQESKCIKKLLHETVIDLGLSSALNEDMDTIINKFRNAPAHAAALGSKSGGRTLIKGKNEQHWTYESLISKLRLPLKERLADKELVKFAGGEDGLVSFVEKDGVWLCNGDVFIFDLLLIKEELLRKVELCKDGSNILCAISFILNSTS